MAEWRIGASTEAAGGLLRSLWAVGEGSPFDGRDRYVGALLAADAALVVDALRHRCVPTQDAYDRAVAALEKHRARADAAERDAAEQTERADLAVARAAVAADDAARAESDATAFRAALADLAAAVDRQDRPAMATALQAATEALGRG